MAVLAVDRTWGYAAVVRGGRRCLSAYAHATPCPVLRSRIVRGRSQNLDVRGRRARVGAYACAMPCPVLTSVPACRFQVDWGACFSPMRVLSPHQRPPSSLALRRFGVACARIARGDAWIACFPAQLADFSAVCFRERGQGKSKCRGRCPPTRSVLSSYAPATPYPVLTLCMLLPAMSGTDIGSPWY
eukprot:2428932-Rhodomonas_salina.2